MEFRYTSHQTARGSRPDSVSGSEWYLIKNTCDLRLTYQIRLLTWMAGERDARLVIYVPKTVRLSRDLRSFVKQHAKTVKLRKEL